jgi:SAM-dependent methyltransferase
MLVDKEKLKSSLVDRRAVIQALININKYTRYLEIGCDTNHAFDVIMCDVKVGVDPNKGGTHRMTSDEFFAKNVDKFDIVFIDGDHNHGQVYKDLQNALSVIPPNGSIVMHDCNPLNPGNEIPQRCGTAWRAFAVHRMRDDLDMIVCDFDYGVGIVRFGKNKNPIVLTKSMDDMVHADLKQNRLEWLNLSTKEQAADWILEIYSRST